MGCLLSNVLLRLHVHVCVFTYMYTYIHVHVLYNDGIELSLFIVRLIVFFCAVFACLVYDGNQNCLVAIVWLYGWLYVVASPLADMVFTNW